MTSVSRPPNAATPSTEPEPWPRVPKLEDHHFVTEPMESERHLIALILFYQLMREALRDRADVYIGADLVVYFSELQVKNKDFRAPDGVVVLGVEPRERKGWIVWEEDGRYPDLVVEHMSPSTRDTDLGTKVRIYGQIWKVREYFAFDLESGEIHAFEGTGMGLERKTPNAAGRFRSDVLGAEVGVSDLPAEGRDGPWMRLFTADGAPLMTRAERADSEAKRADAEAKARAAAEARAAALEVELAELRARLGASE